jgi:L-cysteine/cystine lyase
MVALRDLAEAVGPRTRVVACSHVSWVGGEVAPEALAETGVPVVLDGAQGIGAVRVDVGALGCAAYAGAGQKWLCGADGTGMLFLSPAFRDGLRVVAPCYHSFADANEGMDSPLRETAQRFDTPSLSREAAAFSLAALQVLERNGVAELQARAAKLTARLAERLAGLGRVVAPRGATTLVSWEEPDPPAARERLAAAGVIVRNLPGRPYLRASVGAWNDDDDLDRLLGAL